MQRSPKKAVVAAVTRLPLYHVFPPGALRAFACLRYYGENRSVRETVDLIESMGGISTKYFSVAIVAARAAFRAGADEHMERALADLDRRFPEKPELHNLHADVHAHYDRNEEAYLAARRARLLQPSSAAAVYRTVKYGYRVLPHAEADAAAVAAIRRMPRAQTVLWGVAKLCDSPEHYARLREAWESAADDVTDLWRAVRQLSTAAARAGEIDEAIDLYRQVIELMRDKRVPAEPVGETKLAGLGAQSAIEDLHEVLEQTGIRYFFAAGTALGLVREGRPLSEDGDIDVGIFEDDYDQDELVKLFATHPKFDFDEVHPKTKKVGLRHRGGSPVDLFRFYRDGDKMWHDAVFVRWGNQPFELDRIEMNGRSLPVPAEADRYLTENYGDWRTPNASFDAFTEEAPNMEPTWPEYVRLHYVRRAYKALCAGEPNTAARDLERAGLEDLADSLTKGS
ncbi:LicD family protein [Glycomyces salinus]|uniref:LicD family protein n=1 Tax=Glycomyces salinus TaxID=980294 RepID=UPI0018EBE0EC|nr:LicD family protein [Glycomyces salinus]